MRLTPSDPDIQTLIGRIQSAEIDLQPDFQRGEVWSVGKKQRLIDSILRDWHIPPIHVVIAPDSGQQLVLDGQQRLSAIRDFVDGQFAVDGRLEPSSEELRNLHGKRYNNLPPELRRRFDQFTIRVFRITDYAPSEPGELFYRLNQPTALTAAEQRNAFFGETRKQVKELVAQFDTAALGNQFWGFTNARMAYDDILSRVAMFLEQNTLRKKVTAGSLADRFRSGKPFELSAINSLVHVIELLRLAKPSLKVNLNLNKATAQSWFIFLAVAEKYFGNDLTPETVAAFMSTFEHDHIEHQFGTRESFTPEQLFRENLMRIYEDRSTSRVADSLSVQLRDFILWSCFLQSMPEFAAKIDSNNYALTQLNMLLRHPQHEVWSNIERLVPSLNWGDPLCL